MSTSTASNELEANLNLLWPLENGDRLKAPEFERRYEMMPHLKKAELIQGIVYTQPSVRVSSHGQPHAEITGWLGLYRIATPHVLAADSSTVRLDDDNQPQPDACLLIDSAHGGQSHVVDGYLTDAPELAAEVASSTVSYDLHQKKEVYAQFGVREYVVWRVLDRGIDWWKLRDGEYELLPVDSEGVIRSETFPGLWLASRALAAGNMAEVQAVLALGLADPSHAAFVARLRGGEVSLAPTEETE